MLDQLGTALGGMLDSGKSAIANYGNPQHKSEIEVEYDDVEDKWQQAKDARTRMEKVWLEDLAFYHGNQWLMWNDATKTLEPPDVPSYRVLMVVNLIQPNILTEYAKLIQQRPSAEVRPLSDEPDDLRKARVNNKVLEYLWEPSGSEDAKNEALLWALTLGTGLIKEYWDTAKGPVLDDPLRKVRVQLGDVCAISISPFEFFPEPLAKTMKEMNWAFHSKMRTSEYVLEKYGIEMSESDHSYDESLEGRVAQLTDMSSTSKTKGILVREFHQRATTKFPQGRLIVYAGDKVVEAVPHPYKQVKTKVPFVGWKHRPVPGRFWGDSAVNQLKDVQRNYNKSRSQSIEIRNLMSKPKWTIPIGSIPDNVEITSAPGEMVRYIPIGVHKPEPIAGKDVPVTFWRDLEQSRSEFREVSGIHEVTQGQVPGQVRAAAAIQSLQEQDDLRLGPAAMSFEQAIADLERMKLALAKQYYEEGRIARVVGEGNRMEIIEFTSDDIYEDPDIIVRAGSSLPKSKSARQQFLFDLWDRGLIPDPRVILKNMEFDQVEGVFDEVNRDITQAERENDSMKSIINPDPNEPQPLQPPQPPQARDFHNHDLHLFAHNRLRKSEEYDNYAPEQQGIFDEHCMQHQAFQMQAMMQQAAMQPQGGPGQAPAPNQQGARRSGFAESKVQASAQ